MPLKVILLGHPLLIISPEYSQQIPCLFSSISQTHDNLQNLFYPF
jgi:hypothetical protein